jgi:hypothetical protein
MGRVRRYKKFKSCDPYAKKSNINSNNNNDYDEPPDLFDERKQQWKSKKDKILEKTMVDFNHHEMKIIKANLKTNTKTNNTTTSINNTSTNNTTKIEPKRDNETAKEFAQRIRTTTRLTLRDELNALRSSVKKRKERLKERKDKRKNKGKKTDDDDEGHPEFYAREDGYLRPSGNFITFIIATNIVTYFNN